MNRITVITNILWRYAERFSCQVIALVVTIILARILVPADFGLIALVTVIIGVLNVLIDSGLSAALIQKKNADETDFSTVFYFNIVACAVLYLAIFLLAPFIADYYGNGELTLIVRVLCLMLLVTGVRSIQEAFIARNLLFKKYFLSTLSGTIVSAVVGIGLAMSGYGVWAIVAQQLTNSILSTAVLWVTVKWRPSRLFSFSRWKSLFRYGWKLLAATLISSVFDNLRQSIIGKQYTLDDLGFYSKGEQFPNVLIVNINASINSVSFPTFSSLQDDLTKLEQVARRAVKLTAFVVAPIAIGLAACAPQLVSVLLTEKWMPCVPYLRVFCFAYLVFPLSVINQNVIKARGRSGLFLMLEVTKKAIGFALILLTASLGVWAMCLSYLAYSILAYVIDALPNRRIVHYSLFEQCRDIFPCLAIALIMGICVWAVSLLGLSDPLTLCIQIVIGAAVYVAESAMLRIDSFTYLLDTLRMAFRSE